MGGMSLGLIEAVRRRGTPAVGVVIDDWLVYGPKVDAWQRACRRLGPLRGAAERLAGVPAAVDLDAAGRWLFVSEAARAGARRSGLELADPPWCTVGDGPRALHAGRRARLGVASALRRPHRRTQGADGRRQARSPTAAGDASPSPATG